MRARNIKPGFFKNEELAGCEPLARILFAGLWCYCDREGRFEWRPMRIKAEILPYDECNIMSLTCQLHDMKLIYFYKVDERTYVFIPTFLDHNNPHPHEAKSKCPPFSQENQCHDMSFTSNGHASDMSMKCRASSLNPESLLLNPESSQVELASLLFDLIKERRPSLKEPNFKEWANHIDLMIRIDKRDPEEIRKLIELCQADPFWQNNILSTQKLRKQYDQLALKLIHQSKEDPTKNTGLQYQDPALYGSPEWKERYPEDV